MTDDTTAAAAEEYLTRHLCDDAIFLYGHQVLGAFEAGAAYGAKQALRELSKKMMYTTIGKGEPYLLQKVEQYIQAIEQQLAGGDKQEAKE